MKSQPGTRSYRRWNWNLVQGRLFTAIGDDQINQLHAYLPPDGEPSSADVDHAMRLAGVKEIPQESSPKRPRAKVAHRC